MVGIKIEFICNATNYKYDLFIGLESGYCLFQLTIIMK